MSKFPRITIAGISGDSGKTVLTCGLIRALKNRGLDIRAFKKGPDYIDPAWLKLASGNEVRNLDTYLTSRDLVKRSFTTFAENASISVIEGNRGLYDGFDEKGTHSTAELAKLIKSPIIVILTPRKVTRTVAAFILGLQKMDAEADIRAVILNKVSGNRHKEVISKAIFETTGIPVLGALPAYKGELMPSRHLGLITPSEHKEADRGIEISSKLVDENLDIQEIIKIAESAPELTNLSVYNSSIIPSKVRIAWFKDRVFTFYYPENLEMLERCGAELVPVSSVDDKALPENIDGLYIGGGFPETNADSIVGNKSMMESVKEASEYGLPIYAECGGLIYLSRSLNYNDRSYNMAGVFGIDLKMNEKPSGHGYAIVKIDKENPFFETGIELKGHEFHYSDPICWNVEIMSCMAVQRGTGAWNKRDGLIYKNTFATYVHIHALTNPKWAEKFVKIAFDYRNLKRQ